LGPEELARFDAPEVELEPIFTAFRPNLTPVVAADRKRPFWSPRTAAVGLGWSSFFDPNRNHMIAELATRSNGVNFMSTMIPTSPCRTTQPSRLPEAQH